MSLKSTSNVEYSVVLHDADEGGYWVEVPALPGCYSQGETREDALINVREAIELYLEGLQAKGESPRSDTDVVFRVTIAA
jgi:predicted RNase H-like HicB family nuclease